MPLYVSTMINTEHFELKKICMDLDRDFDVGNGYKDSVNVGTHMYMCNPNVFK